MSEGVLNGLRPEALWSIFEEITRIPRPSTKEEKIRNWVKRWASTRGIPFKEDETGNLLLLKSAAPGCADYPGLVLQAHMDMVCQSASGKTIDFERDPIGIRVEGGFVKAEGTTLGADNGIGMAYALALLAEHDVAHGPLEVLLTVNEETGFTGAFGLKGEFITGSCLLNLDSETQGEVTIGSAGGGRTEYEIPVAGEKLRGQTEIVVSASGLSSGHSGVQIHLPRLNAIKLILEGIGEVEKVVPVRLRSFDGGIALNAIPAQASCSLLVPADERDNAIEALQVWKRTAGTKWKAHEPGMKIDIEPAGRSTGGPPGVWTHLGSEAVLSLLREIPHGPISWNREMAEPGGHPGLVQTSNNLALVQSGAKRVRVACLSRSSLDRELAELRFALRRIGEARGARVEQDDPYPGWNTDTRSPFVQLVKKCYERVSGGRVRLTAVHAGLECGLFTKLYPRLQMASIGPDIANAHSPEESVSIESVQVVWGVLLEIVGSIGTLPNG
jgi:dipeptidase D